LMLPRAMRCLIAFDCTIVIAEEFSSPLRIYRSMPPGPARRRFRGRRSPSPSAADCQARYPSSEKSEAIRLLEKTVVGTVVVG
jgi:hypothetical protein